MTNRESVPTGSGEFTVRNGHLRVRTTPRGVVRNIYLDSWKEKDKLQQGWVVFSTVLAMVTFGQFVSEWLGFSGELLSVGFVLSAVLVYALFLALKLGHGRLRGDISIPLRTIREAERGSDRTKLRVVHGEFEDVASTEIEFPSESDAEQAIELLRWKGIRIAEVGNEKTNFRTEIDRELETETA